MQLKTVSFLMQLKAVSLLMQLKTVSFLMQLKAVSLLMQLKILSLLQIENLQLIRDSERRSGRGTGPAAGRQAFKT